MLTQRFDDAVAYARTLHADDVRKGTTVPYLAHLLGVSSLVLEHGGDEDQAIAALLHDAAEDHGGRARLADIAARFGTRVAAIVEACSDSLVADRHHKAPWWPRKAAYLRALATEPPDALLVTAADKLHNARALVADHRRDGDALWARFNPDAGRRGQLWYQRRLHEVLADRVASLGDGDGRSDALASLVGELGRTVARLWDEVASTSSVDVLEAEWHEALAEERGLVAAAATDDGSARPVEAAALQLR